MKKTIITASLLVGIGIIIGVFLVSQVSPESITSLFAQNNKEIGAKTPPVNVDASALAINNAMTQVSEAVLPQVVSISVSIERSRGGMTGMDERFRDFFKYFGIPEDGEQENYRSKGAGSGVIVTSDGYIVTNNHVVEDAIKGGIEITLFNKRKYQAELVGLDPLTDLAVLKINPDGDLPTAHFEQMKDVKVGQFVLAVGNPLGLNSTVTSGIVSAVGRGRIGNMSAGRSSYSVEHFIQTDAAINPGNSGGGLFNLNGSLIGINTAIATGTGSYIGYGFAIPIDLVKTVVQDLIEDGKIDRGYIGVQIRNIDETDARSFQLDRVEGVLVTSVLPDGAAKRAGMESGDVILELDGEPVRTTSELQSRIVFRRAGDDVRLTIWRDGKQIYKTVQLQAAEREESVSLGQVEEQTEPDTDTNPVSFEKLGFSVQKLNSDIKKKYNVANGVFVSDVKRYSVADERSLYPGAVITKADRKEVKSVKQFKELVNSKKTGETLLLQVKYEDISQIVTLQVPN